MRWIRSRGSLLAGAVGALLAAGHQVTYLTRRQWEGDLSPERGVRFEAVSGAGELYTTDGVRRAGPAPEGFDARFSALHRAYTYRVVDDPEQRDPLRREWTLWNRRPLDVAAMGSYERCVGIAAPQLGLGVLLNAVFLDLIDQDSLRLETVNKLVEKVPLDLDVLFELNRLLEHAVLRQRHSRSRGHRDRGRPRRHSIRDRRPVVAQADHLRHRADGRTGALLQRPALAQLGSAHRSRRQGASALSIPA